MMARRIPTSMNPHVLRGSVSWLQSSGACEIAVAFGASLLRGEIAVVLVSRRKRRVGLLSPASGGFVVDSRKQVIRVGFSCGSLGRAASPLRLCATVRPHHQTEHIAFMRHSYRGEIGYQHVCPC